MRPTLRIEDLQAGSSWPVIAALIVGLDSRLVPVIPKDHCNAPTTVGDSINWGKELKFQPCRKVLRCPLAPTWNSLLPLKSASEWSSSPSRVPLPPFQPLRKTNSLHSNVATCPS